MPDTAPPGPATAQAGGCEVVLAEDLSHGTTIGGVRVENPFSSVS